jgi:hypothetical protein
VSPSTSATQRRPLPLGGAGRWREGRRDGEGAASTGAREQEAAHAYTASVPKSKLICRSSRALSSAPASRPPAGATGSTRFSACGITCSSSRRAAPQLAQGGGTPAMRPRDPTCARTGLSFRRGALARDGARGTHPNRLHSGVAGVRGLVVAHALSRRRGHAALERDEDPVDLGLLRLRLRLRLRALLALILAALGPPCARPLRRSGRFLAPVPVQHLFDVLILRLVSCALPASAARAYPPLSGAALKFCIRAPSTYGQQAWHAMPSNLAVLARPTAPSQSQTPAVTAPRARRPPPARLAPAPA